jgi:uncharacterized protein HemY
MTLSQIQGLVDLGMFPDALTALAALPDDLQQAPMALRLRLRTLAALGKWEAAGAIADTLRHGNDLDREEAASCYQSLAAEHFNHGRLDQARNLLRRAIGTQPERRQMILEDRRFTGKFVKPFAPQAPDAAAG